MTPQCFLRFFASDRLQLAAQLGTHLDNVVANIIDPFFNRATHFGADGLVDEAHDVLLCHSRRHDANHARFHSGPGFLRA